MNYFGQTMAMKLPCFKQLNGESFEEKADGVENLTALCVRILMVARMSKDVAGMLICSGVFAMLFFQIVVNIGMVLCILPVVGVTLPFFSAGGTSAVVSYMAIGLVLSVYRKNKKTLMFD